ncbi:MAG TPA: tRNA preQ1(34) S-adenosylmethionine ribosyltransferase-isomerase QueA, partial [Thermoanaerobaculia bacterium]|nr:tRNA preQ1(34) S-adenosylmethionine ribosyltransferase-isomerase QueA [Thermoanaerobaculia bacterium]
APGDLVVRNDVAVRHARLYGHDAEGRLVEIFLLKTIDEDSRRWTTLARPGRRAKAGRTISLPGGLTALVVSVAGDGKRSVRFDREIDTEVLSQIGHVPLPPYIRREPGAPDRPEDREAYQTVFAKDPLAVAAPTAGLHFTAEIFERLKARGIDIVDLTLAVGAGTFKPVVAEDTDAHAIEQEEVHLPAPALARIRRQLESRGRIVAVGTTVTRALEAAARLKDGLSGSQDLRFTTDLFITPGFEFHVVGALLTNFHLPRSTLFMLTCAFAGRERALAAYAESIRKKYRFYSFGDAMLIA